MGERKLKEVREKDPAVSRFILMFPPSPALVPVFKRFLQMELYRVNQLTFASSHHHLVAAKIRSGEEFESRGNLIELETVVLPDAQDPWLLLIVLQLSSI